MLTEVIEIIKETFSPIIEVTGDTAIKSDLQLDSFDIMNLISIIENRYKISIDDVDTFSLATVDDLSNCLDHKLTNLR